MSYVFEGATLFNANVSQWDVSSVTDTTGMFKGASTFDVDISNWDVSKVVNMDSMFYEATSFSQTLCGNAWIESTASKTDMFTSSSGSICGSTTPMRFLFQARGPGTTVVSTTPIPILLQARGPGTTVVSAQLQNDDLENDPVAPIVGGTVAGVVAVGVVVAVTLKVTVFSAAAAGGAGAAAVGAGAATAGAASAASAVSATGATSTMVGSYAGIAVAASGAMPAAALLVKHGLEPKGLHQTNILSPESSAERMMSKEVLKVKHAPDMSLMASVTHFTFLLSEKNLDFVHGERSKTPIKLEAEIEEFAKSAFFPKEKPNAENSCDDENAFKASSESSSCTANAAAEIFRKTSIQRKRSERGIRVMDAIGKNDRDILINKAKRSLAWAQDPDRPDIDGAEEMTHDEAGAVMLYTQETCLYRRLNAALRNFDKLNLEPFLPFMKLLLSALYKLPLTHVRTYRGVKCELYEAYNLLTGHVWSWRAFSSTTRNKEMLLTSNMFLGAKGKRTLFCIKAAGVDIAPFSAMKKEAEILLLPGLPLVNQAGENPEKDLWTFEIKNPPTSGIADDEEPPPVLIDYVHPEWNTCYMTESGTTVLSI